MRSNQPNKPASSSIICNACGKALHPTHPLVGHSINLTAKARTQAQLTAWQSQMAPYNPNVTYNICMPCWLKTLGVKKP